jgi:accessory gene regulator protein AgrB
VVRFRYGKSITIVIDLHFSLALDFDTANSEHRTLVSGNHRNKEEKTKMWLMLILLVLLMLILMLMLMLSVGRC